MSTTPAPAIAPVTNGPPEVSARILAILLAGFAACFALMAVKVDHAFGLPAHPLLLHVPVIFDPILALSSILLALRPDLRRRYGVIWAGFALVALASTVLTASAGDSLLDSRPRVDKILHDHKDAGEMLRTLMFGLTAAILLTIAVDWLRDTGRGPALLRGAAIGAVLTALVIALSGASGFYTVRAGHLGAKAVWANEGRGEGGPPGGFPGGGGPGY